MELTQETSTACGTLPVHEQIEANESRDRIAELLMSGLSASEKARWRLDCGKILSSKELKGLLIEAGPPEGILLDFEGRQVLDAATGNQIRYNESVGVKIVEHVFDYIYGKNRQEAA